MLNLRVKAGRSHAAPVRRVVDADGQEAVALCVAAPPEKGKANAAVVAVVAKALGLRQSQVKIVSGQTSSRKLLCLDGTLAALTPRLHEWLSV